MPLVQICYRNRRHSALQIATCQQAQRCLVGEGYGSHSFLVLGIGGMTVADCSAGCFFFFPHSSCDSEIRAKDMFENREICYVMITD